MKAFFQVSGCILNVEDRGHDRSSITFSKKGKALTVVVEAGDAVAFRAACNTVLKQIVLLEKAKGVK